MHLRHPAGSIPAFRYRSAARAAATAWKPSCAGSAAAPVPHIGIGRTYAGTCVLLLVQDLDIRVIDAATGELLRELTLDPARDYQPTGQPPGPKKKTPRT